ncbi:MAG TPA: CopD family protein [Terriglobia bacterium]|nr:CopD family protein [Terriglobia bacterium]
MSTLMTWTLVFHILGIVFWLGSLLVVTHVLASDAESESAEVHEVLSRLEAKLFNGIAHPGAIIAVISGAILISTNTNYYLHAAWLHVKLFLVVIIIVLDAVTYVRAKAFHAGRITLQRKECMMLHGGIALVFIGILIMVLIKPF